MLKNTKSDNKYVTILADGLLHLAATEETEGAVKRTYETSDGVKGEKWELQYTELSGMITKLAFNEGKFGKQLQITVTDDESDTIVLSVGVDSPFGEDIMKKLPNVDMKKPVKFAPYSFEDDKGKRRRGVTIYQDEAKIASFYYDPEAKKAINGYPVPKIPKVKKGEKVPTSFWKLFYMQANLFLVEDLTKRLKIEESEVEDDGDDELDAMVEEAGKALD